MNRREFLVTSAALAIVPSTLLRPVKRRTVDLAAWCNSHWRSRRYDAGKPFRQGDYTYATDGRACIRVEPVAADVNDGEARLPPAERLPWWQQFDRSGWSPLPENPRTLDAVSWCLSCDGTGVQAPRKECKNCEGFGCDRCAWSGWISSRGDCPTCRGKGSLLRPSIACVGPLLIDLSLWQRLAVLGGGDYRIADGAVPRSTEAPMMFRFSAGRGLMVPLVRDAAMRRVADAAKGCAP